MASSKVMLVAALDFGTTYSGYAFSLKHNYQKDPLKIHANQAWNAGGRQLMSLKTPTCLLLDNKKNSFHLDTRLKMNMQTWPWMEIKMNTTISTDSK